MGAISGLWHPRFRSRGWHLICCSPSSCSPFHCRSDFRRSDLGCVSALSVHRSDCTGHENAASRRSAIRRMLDLSGGPHLRLLSPWQSVTFSGTSVLASGDHEARPPSQDVMHCSLSLLLLGIFAAASVPLKCMSSDFPVYFCLGSVAMVKHRSWSTKGIPPPPPAPPRRHPIRATVDPSVTQSHCTSQLHKSEQHWIGRCWCAIAARCFERAFAPNICQIPLCCGPSHLCDNAAIAVYSAESCHF